MKPQKTKEHKLTVIDEAQTETSPQEATKKSYLDAVLEELSARDKLYRRRERNKYWTDDYCIGIADGFKKAAELLVLYNNQDYNLLLIERDAYEEEMEKLEEYQEALADIAKILEQLN